MKVLSIVVLFGLILHAQSASEEVIQVDDDPCAEPTIDECVHTEFSDYMKCIEEIKSKRIKRQAQCPFLVNAQPQPVYYVAQQQVPQVIQGGQNAGVITENHAEYLPQPAVNRQIIVSSNGDTTPVRYSNSASIPGHNITTVINLNNIINNTNIIDSPTNINNTNINNIHLYHNKTSTSGGKYGLGYTEKGSCCFVVQPKSCRKTSHGPKCHHRRHKTCSSQCTSRIMHVQTRRQNSHRRTVHIPQPPPQRCVSTYYWPYTSCGGYQQNSCDGCYDHYDYGYENYYGGYGNSEDCYGCYDDGYDHGPLYRRGPVLRPTHHHEPPCELSGSCDNDDNYNWNGNLGNDRMNPVFKNDEYAVFEGDDHYFARNFNISNVDANDDEGNDEESGDWAINSRKCRVVEESDGSIIIRNCTLNDLDNQYAGSPHTTRHEAPDQRRIDRRASPPYYNYPPPMYYPPPSPYMSPYMALPPPPPVRYMPPPQHYRRRNYYDGRNEEQYDDEDYDNEVDYRPKPKRVDKKRSNRHENRFPIDEEDLDLFKNDDREFDVYDENK